MPSLHFPPSGIVPADPRSPHPGREKSTSLRGASAPSYPEGFVSPDRGWSHRLPGQAKPSRNGCAGGIRSYSIRHALGPRSRGDRTRPCPRGRRTFGGEVDRPAPRRQERTRRADALHAQPLNQAFRYLDGLLEGKKVSAAVCPNCSTRTSGCGVVAYRKGLPSTRTAASAGLRDPAHGRGGIDQPHRLGSAGPRPARPQVVRVHDTTRRAEGPVPCPDRPRLSLAPPGRPRTIDSANHRARNALMPFNSICTATITSSIPIRRSIAIRPRSRSTR
jgi:hypothetical protein